MVNGSSDGSNGAVSKAPRPDGNSVLTLRRGLAILDAFTAGSPELGVNEIARQVALHKSTVSRLCATLEQAGYLGRSDLTGKFRLGPRVYQLIGAPSQTADLQRVARPILLSLVGDCGETAHLGVLDGRDAVTIEVVDGYHSVRMQARVGRHVPMHASALGKAIMAWLPPDQLEALLEGYLLTALTASTLTDRQMLLDMLDEIRRQGYSLDQEELEVGLRCVGAPVHDHTGRVVAAISVSGPRDRFGDEAIPHLAQLVRRRAVELSSRLGAPPERGAAGPRGRGAAEQSSINRALGA